MNKYLEKIASRKEGVSVGDVASVGAGAHLLSKVPQRLLGYHKVYHGTTNTNADSIRKNGFDPSKGGTGASKISSSYADQSKGKVHLTKTKLSARMYAGDLGGKIDAEKARNPVSPNKRRTLINALKDSYTGKGSVVKARVPHSTWSRMKVDPDSSAGAPDHAFIQERMKERAATYDRKIDKKFVMGKGGGGMSMYATKNNLRRYLSTKSGRMRALGGAGQLVAGSALIHNAIANRGKPVEV